VTTHPLHRLLLEHLRGLDPDFPDVVEVYGGQGTIEFRMVVDTAEQLAIARQAAVEFAPGRPVISTPQPRPTVTFTLARLVVPIDLAELSGWEHSSPGGGQITTASVGPERLGAGHLVRWPAGGEWAVILRVEHVDGYAYPFITVHQGDGQVVRRLATSAHEIRTDTIVSHEDVRAHPAVSDV
jgi:hypothetical protein